ncbi:sugar transporter family protein [Stylonychia lemnae]|uniref:Hexose transporter 1 n=1 Tax=Stylonychia lemnae TaxID=5949 RepID=A0A077ZWN4_STYLE|nr:sugar transporter family protein [Stylonychia lemnae]|eukprot:CDW74001.1 sugar transporter family protein [Stylonychia lemnae]
MQRITSIREQKKFKTNLTFLIIFSLFMDLGEILIGYIISCTNQTTTTFNVKFDFVNENQALYQGLIGSSGVLGMTIGAISGGKIMQGGRKWAFQFSSIIGVIGSGISLIENIPAILIGRTLFGFACGVQSVCIPRFIEETVPQHQYQVYSTIATLCQGVGSLIAMAMGEGFQDDSDTEALKKSGFWRVIFGFPLVLYVVCIIGVQFYVKYESVKYCIFNDRREEAKKMIKNVYHKSENPEEIIIGFEINTQRDTSFVTLKQAMSSDKYRKGTILVIILIIFHELTGINAILLYSNTMFKQMGLQKPRLGTYGLGVAQLFGLGIAIWMLKKVGRRLLLITGHFLMATCHLLIGIFAYQNMSIWVAVMMISFIMTYQITNGPVIWLYTSEVVVDTALGACIFTLWGTVLVLSLTTNFLMNSALRPQGVFWLFSGISIFGGIYCIIFIRETKGLTDKEKKTLYSPQNLKSSAAFQQHESIEF